MHFAHNFMSNSGIKWSWPDSNIISQDFLGGAEKSHENLSQDSQCLGQDLNPGPRKYEAGVLTTLP